MKLSIFGLRGTAAVITVIVALAVVGGVVWLILSLMRSGAEQGAPESALPAKTAMGVVELNVSDVESMRSFYEEAVGLAVLDESANKVTLGFESPLISLTKVTDEDSASTATEAGLYHSAILYPDEATLAATLVNVAALAPDSFQGSADHRVSQAFYFVDPEGNGVELYVDRPESKWVWQNGEVQMGSEALDPTAFIQEHLSSSNSPPDSAEMGHVHLKVGDLDEAERFYADTLGFAVTARADGALFYSAGGYHHHLATNTWQSAGVGKRGNPIGLGVVGIEVPDAAAIIELEGRLAAADVSFEQVDGGVLVVDPWGNVVSVTSS